MTKRTGHLALFSANILFGINNPLTRTLMPDIFDSFSLTFFRMIGGAILFWLASLFVKKEKLPKKDILKLFFASIFGIVLNQFLFFKGLSTTSPIDASLVVTLLPILTMILAAFIIREPITWMKTVGVVIGASGAFILIFGSSNGSGKGDITGDIFVFIAQISFALYLTLFKDIITKYSPVTTMKWMFLFAAIISFPVCKNSLSQIDFSALNGVIYWKVFYVVVFATFISYLLIPIGQKTLRPTTLSMYNYLQPIVASILTVIIGLDKFSYNNVIAAILVFSGVYIVTQSKAKNQPNIN